jgi:hypothetical protein
VELRGGKVHGGDGELSVALCGNESKRGRENERELAGGARRGDLGASSGLTSGPITSVRPAHGACGLCRVGQLAGLKWPSGLDHLTETP